jgi:hypothetical protein
MRTRKVSMGCGGISCSGLGCLIIILVNLLIGSTAAKYCLLNWLPPLHTAFPQTFSLLDPNTSVWSLKLMLLGVLGGELFIPGAIITWLLIGLGIVTVAH